MAEVPQKVPHSQQAANDLTHALRPTLYWRHALHPYAAPLTDVR